MEFRFDLKPIFTNSIIKVDSSLLPANFRGDRRTALETTAKMAEIINTIGEHSAKAQGLSKPITTAQKLRMSDQNLYLLGDPNTGKNGAVIGLLKVGRKTLYIFDGNGETHTVNAPCVLDFYIHESRQRSGLGKTLFDIMLNEEKFEPAKFAIDRPSDKLLKFLKKHYDLQETIPQMNNFVIYEGFFDTPNDTHNIDVNVKRQAEITVCPNTALFGPQVGSDDFKRINQQTAAANIPTIQNSPVGRYAARRPACSMAEVFNNEQVIQNPNPSNQQQQQVAQNYAQPQQNIVNSGNFQMMQPLQQQQVLNQNQQISQAMPQIVTQAVPQQSMSQTIIQNTAQSMPQQIIQNPIQSVPQQMTQHPVQVAPQQVIQNPNQQFISQQIPQNVVQSFPPQTPQSSVQTMPQNPVQQNVQSMSQPMAQAMSQQVPQPIIQQSVSVPMSQTMPQQMSQAIPLQVTQAMPQQISQAMPQQVSQAIPQQVTQAVPQEMVQATLQQIIPQNIASGVQQMENSPPQQTINRNVFDHNTSEGRNDDGSYILARRYRANGLSEDPQNAVYVSSNTTKYLHAAGKPSGLAIDRQRSHNVSDFGRPPTISEQTNANKISSQVPFNQIPQVPVQNYQVPPPPIAINQVPLNVMPRSQVSATTAQIINQVPPPPINVNSQYQLHGQTNQNIQNISMEQQQQQQPQQFQQQQNQVYVPQNQTQNIQNTDPNAKDFSLRGNESFTSIKSRRFKADGLASDPQHVIYNPKFDASKMIPAGKPSGMRYNTGKLNNSSSLPGIPNTVGQMNTTNSTPNIPGTSFSQSVPQQQMNSMSIDNNAQMIQSVQVPTPQMVTTQMQNLQMLSGQVPTPQMVTTQVQNPQIVNLQQMGGQTMNPPVQGIQMTNPQAIVTQQQLINAPQIMNTQQSVCAPAANLQVMNPQMINAQAPTNQAIMNQQSDQNIQMHVVPVNSQQVMNSSQIIKGQMMNAGQIQNMQVPQIETAQMQNLSQIIPPPRVINNQIVDGGQMGDGQMKNNQINYPQMIIHSSATPATGESKSRRESGTQEIELFETKSVDGGDNEKNITNEEIKTAIENLKIDNDKTENNIENIEQKVTNGHSNIEDYNNEIQQQQQQQQQQHHELNIIPPSSDILHINKPQNFPVNKQHTGLKNISYNVGLAVSPTNKMEFGKHERTISGSGHSPSGNDNTDAQSIVSSAGSDGYTEQGYHDLKFFHSKLW